MYRAILVPLDGSAFGEQALPVALSIARRAGASVRLAHVHVAGRSPFVDRLTQPGDAVDRQARAAERAYLERQAQCRGTPGICHLRLRACARCRS